MLIRNRWMLAALLCAGLLGTSVLGKTKLMQSWADPSAPNYKFTKVLAVVLLDHAETRRLAETTIVKNVKSVLVIPSCTVLQKGEERDVEKAKQTIRKEGFDGVIVMRLYNASDKAQYVAPTFPSYYWNYFSYSNAAMPVLSTPGYLKYDRIVQVETLLYSLKDEKLLWSFVSETSNPEDAMKAVNDIAKVIQKELKKKGILK